MLLFDRANILWDYFKRGNSELRNFYGIWTLILTLSIKFSIDISWSRMAVWGVFWIPICIGVGHFFTKKVNIAANKTNPYTQDSILSAINLQQSFIYYFQCLLETASQKERVHLENALDEMNKAQQLREKWLV